MTSLSLAVPRLEVDKHSPRPRRRRSGGQGASRAVRLSLASLVILMSLALGVGDANAVRIKDIAYVNGVRNNQLLGYGLVVGLDGTGDYGRSEFTVQSTASMLGRMGIRVDPDSIQTRNVAAVMVTADLTPFARSGQRLSVQVSSLGNARSLQGGTLIMTPMLGPDGEVYAMAQGALSLGGYSADGGFGNRESQGHDTVGLIPDGAIVERNLEIEITDASTLRLNLHDPDFSTAVNVAREVSAFFDPSIRANTDSMSPFVGIAEAIDGSTIVINIPEDFQHSVTQFISLVEEIDVQRDTVARVIVNERTGTVVLSGNVSMGTVAVAHGNLTVTVDTQFGASQPEPFGNGDTTLVPDAQLDVQQDQIRLHLLESSNTLADVVAALNALGTTSRDLIAILQAIDAAGALNGELVIQ